MKWENLKMKKTKNYNQDSSNGHIALPKSIAKANEQPLAKGENVGSNPIPDANLKQNIILDLCGGTGSWSEPFRKAGFKVVVLDIKDGWDIKHFIDEGSKIKFLNIQETEGKEFVERRFFKKNIFGVLSAPPCTQFSFARTKAKTKRKLYEGMEIVEACLRIIWSLNYYMEKPTQKKPHLKFWALENPNGFLKYFLGKPAFEFSPYEFGDDYKKKTHIWGDFEIPKKKDRFENLKFVSSPETLHSLVKFDRMLSKDIHPEYYGKLTRQERRAITPKGFAEAFCRAQLKQLGRR